MSRSFSCGIMVPWEWRKPFTKACKSAGGKTTEGTRAGMLMFMNLDKDERKAMLDLVRKFTPTRMGGRADVLEAAKRGLGK